VSGWSKVVVHADLDCFYAAVEQLDDPSLRGKPVIVGPKSGRGVVLTASYEARPFGVHSAMPMARAIRMCPEGIIVPPRFSRYTELSRRVMDTFADFSPDVEAISLDEAFLDMSGAEGIFGDPIKIGRDLRDAVRERTGLVVSVGVSGTKYVAKVASDYGKPDGLLVVPQERARDFLEPLPVSRLWGAGPKTTEKLNDLGYYTIGQIAYTDPEQLESELGRAGRHFWHLARAEDPRRVHTGRRAQSIGSERTLATDVRDPVLIKRYLRQSADNIGGRLRKKAMCARGVRVKLKTHRFVNMTRQALLPEPTDVGDVLYAAAVQLLDRFDLSQPFRLVGMATFDFSRKDDPVQLDLFAKSAKRRALEHAMDAASERFGTGVVRRAEELSNGVRVGLNLDFLDDG